MRKMLMMLWLSAVCSSAEAGTAFYTGERIGGLTKVCFYDYMGEVYTLNARAVEICPLTVRVGDGLFEPPVSRSGVAFLIGERSGSMLKTCFYDYLGDVVARTVKMWQVCPVTIQP